MIIGICGASGSGKSTIARMIVETKASAVHYDIDKIGHEALELIEVQEEAIKCFGEEIMTDGIIDRKKLGELVFSSRREMKKLSDITWKHMQKQINQIIHSNNKIIILDWILLSSTPYFEMCDKKILVDMPYEIRKDRAIKRDGISSEAFALREKASIQYDKNKFDIIVNNYNMDELRKVVKDL